MFSHIPKLPGVYKFTNILNGKIYIGKAVQLRQRFNNYKGKVKKLKNLPLRERHYDMLFHRALVKYGMDKFKLEILEMFPSRTKFIETLILRREEFWIRIYDATNKKIGYNILPGDQGLGHETTESTKRKISRANSGEKNGMYGKPSNSRIKICKVDILTYQTLEIYNSLLEAGLENQISVPHISGCLKGERIKAGKFHWDRLLDGELEKDSIARREAYFSKRKIKKPQIHTEQRKINASNQRKGKRVPGIRLIKINQIDPATGNIIRTFEAIIDAERFFNPSDKLSGKLFKIHNHIRGKTKLAYGFKWERVNP